MMFLCTESAHSAIVEYRIFFPTFDFFSSLLDMQRYASNWILKMTFWGQTKTGQKLTAGWTGLACISQSHCGNKISFIFLQSPHQVDLKKVVKRWKDFLLCSTTLENTVPKYGWPDICRLHRCKHEKSGGFVGQIMT